MDWTLCIICQKHSEEELRCPLDGAQRDSSGHGITSYALFLENVAEFKELDRLPIALNLSTADLSPEDLGRHEAKWHKSCRGKFSDYKLDRVKKQLERDKQKGIDKRPRRSGSLDKGTCIFCTKCDSDLHEFWTLDADDNIRRMAMDLQDEQLLRKLEGGDVVAQEWKYHLECLTEIRNRHRAYIRQTQKSPHIDKTKAEDQQNKARAFSELISYIESSVYDGTYSFKVCSLREMYANRLNDLGVEISEVNKQRFKEKLLAHFPDAKEESDGRYVILIFKKGMQQLLKESMKENLDEDALILLKAARIIRRETIEMEGFKFEGSFPTSCQEDSVPVTLKSLISMILNGPDINQQEGMDTQACLSIAQLILLNSKKRIRSDKKAATTKRYSSGQEPPLPIYIGLNIHAQTRSKKIITQLYDLGLCISYDRIIQLDSQLANAVCEDIEEKGVVCSPNLRKGLFTVGALDNLDHNPSSSTAQGSFHGTGISLFQFPTESNDGEPQNGISLQTTSAEKTYKLPETYTTVPPVALSKKSIGVPALKTEMRPFDGNLEGAIRKEECWVEHATKVCEEDELGKGEKVSWSAYHSSCLQEEDIKSSLSEVLPLFHEHAATAAMVLHGMNVQKQAIQYLNPGQIPVTAMDAPLYALAKLLQWKRPLTHGEDQFIVMFGGLHIEMAFWKTVGGLLEASGWTTALAEANVASSGTAESLLKAAHLTKTRHAHQVSALTLAKLQKEAFLKSPGPHDEATLQSWKDEMATKSPTFRFWDLILQLELLGCIFVRAQRERDFCLYVECLKAMVPWFFALDHPNYARWLPIHIRDMESLPPSVYKEFVENGHWVVQKTSKKFSSIPIDQAHEQNNGMVKGTGGIIGLTENPVTLRKWMLTAPVKGRLLQEFEDQASLRADDQDKHHHEEGYATQLTFKTQTLSLHKKMAAMGNPFTHNTPDLICLDTRSIMDEEKVKAVQTMEALGKEQYQAYKQSVLDDRTRSIHEPLKRNNLPLFRTKPKSKSRQAQQVTDLKADVALFSKLYIAMQHREGDIEAFFTHENNRYPPSLSDRGKLRSTSKGDLIGCLPIDQQEEPANPVDVKILDGAAVVHFLPNTNATTFGEYATGTFIPHILRELATCTRVDIVWDTYIQNSLKQSTREKRGEGDRKEVAEQNKIPTGKDWTEFLLDSRNKQELFSFLTSKVENVQCPDGKQIIITSGEKVVSKGLENTMTECNHEEADTRMIVHLKNALESGFTSCEIRTVDTDVVTIIIGKFYELLESHPESDIWIAFGVGKDFKFLHINTICAELGEDRSTALPVFHAYSGCDTTSSFHHKGKKSAWEAWVAYPAVTQAFLAIAKHPHAAIQDCDFSLLERFTVILYDRNSDAITVNEARLELFCQKDRALDNIPPTAGALHQHVKRVIHQAGIWSQATLPEQETPSPEGHGWTFEDKYGWVPHWSSRPIASQACKELVKCACKSQRGCVSSCSCRKANWPCTELCRCKCLKNRP